MAPSVKNGESGPGDGPSGGPAELREVFAVAPGGTLYVDLDFGSVRVESHDRSEVRIEATARGWAADLVVFSLERQGKDVQLDGEFEGWLPWFLRGTRVRVRARVPRQYAVDVRTRGGRVRAARIGGRVAADTRGGSVEVEEVDGPALLRTAGGSIRAERVSGALRAYTSGGRIEIDTARGEVDARTSGGAIQVERAGGRVVARTSGGGILAAFSGEPAGLLQTSGGSIEVRIPAGAGVNLDARTSGGRVQVEPPLRATGPHSASHVIGEINAGGAPLRLRTSGGSIRVSAHSPQRE